MAASLVGRDEVLAELMAKLRAGTTSGVFALEGMGGVGKTALAAEAVARLAEDVEVFPGGAAWIACEGLAGEAGLADLWAKVALALGLEQVTAQPDPQRRRVLLAAALAQQPRLLLAMDNIEPGLDADILLETLAVRGHTALLLTARQKVAPLRLKAVELAPLAAPEAQQLLVERLQQVDAARPMAEEASAIPALLEALGGLPLALEVTAAYAGIQRRTLPQVLGEVQADGLSAAALRADPKRAPLVRFERSWLVLTARQQRLFAGLSLLAGASFPREAAQALGHATVEKRAADPAGDLGTLVSCMLVEALPGGERLRLHPLLREYATEKFKTLAPAPQARLGEAMVVFWRAYAEAHPGYEGMDALETEATGLMGALEWAHDHARHWELLELANALGSVWIMRGRRVEQLRIFTWARQAAEMLGDVGGLRWATHQLAETHLQIGRIEEAEQRFREALDFARQEGNLKYEIGELYSLALVDHKTGRLGQARQGYEQVLALAHQLGDPAAEQRALHGLADFDIRAGQPEQARLSLERALAIARHLQDPVAELSELQALAALDSQMGQWDKARQGYEQALEQARQLHDPAEEAFVLGNFGYFLCKHGEKEQGRAMIEQGLAIYERLSDVYAIGRCHEFLARIERDTGNRAEAIAHYREALRRYEQVQSPDAEQVRAELRRLGEQA